MLECNIPYILLLSIPFVNTVWPYILIGSHMNITVISCAFHHQLIKQWLMYHTFMATTSFQGIFRVKHVSARVSRAVMCTTFVMHALSWSNNNNKFNIIRFMNHINQPALHPPSFSIRYNYGDSRLHTVYNSSSAEVLKASYRAQIRAFVGVDESNVSSCITPLVE